MATMDNSERGYFNTDHSIGKGGYESMFGMDPALFNTSTSMLQEPNSHQDLDNILGGQFMDQLGSGSGMMTPGFSAWNAQGTAYSPYPDMSYSQAMSVDQQQAGAGAGAGSISNDFAQSFPESNGVDIQAVQINRLQAPTSSTADQNTSTTEPVAKRKLDSAPDATDETQPKPKKKRGPRKTKQKTEEEKRAKEERKLERNRMAASKCRQKKKVATEQMMEDFNELERQNHWMKACLEEIKQERNRILALLLEHKECSHPAVDKCLEAQLTRIAEEFDNPPQADMFALNDDAEQFLNSNASSPSNESQNRSRRNSRSSIAMSRSSSNASHQKSATVSHAPQSWPTAGYQSWQEQFGMSQGYQQQPTSEPSKTSHHHSPTSYSTPGTSMSRQNSSQTSASGEHGDHQRIDSGISEMDTPPEERKKNLPDSPDDEGIALAATDRVLRSRGPHMMANQRIPNMRPQIQLPAGPSDLQDPSVFLGGGDL